MSAVPFVDGEASALGCPACVSRSPAQPLPSAAEGGACPACHQRYPSLGGVRCLVPHPTRYLLEQVGLLRDYLSVTDVRRQQIAVEASAPALLASTRERLTRLLGAMEAEQQLVRSVLRPLVEAADGEVVARLAPAAVPAPEPRLLDMYEAVFRDWAWGDAESELSLAALAETVARGRVDLGRLAVFGAGACRLAADVHRSLGPVITYALDINPLPLLIAHRLLGGETLEAYEYPVGPRGLENTAVLQRLRPPAPLRSGLVLALADARQPPFGADRLDSVLTPWYIDVVSAELTETASTIHRVLRPGGVWLNQGPLRFGGTAARRYSIEEVRELVQASGFELLAELQRDLPYFDSPHAGSRRTETIYGFAARKVSPTRDVTLTNTEPAWLQDPTRAVPATPGLGALQERLMLCAAALSLVDGARSIAEIADALSEELGLPAERLRAPLASLLASLLPSR